MKNFLSGYKTYLFSGLGILSIIGLLTHVLNSDTATSLILFSGFGGIASLRSGIKKAEAVAKTIYDLLNQADTDLSTVDPNDGREGAGGGIA